MNTLLNRLTKSVNWESKQEKQKTKQENFVKVNNKDVVNC